MSHALQLATLTGIATLLYVLYLYRKGKLKEDYTILWILISTAIILLSAWTDLLLVINWIVGASRISELVLAGFVAFLLIISIYYSASLSELAEQNKKLAQEIAILKALIDEDRPNNLNEKDGRSHKS